LTGPRFELKTNSHCSVLQGAQTELFIPIIIWTNILFQLFINLFSINYNEILENKAQVNVK